MNQATDTNATQSTSAAATSPTLPRRPRLGSAIASVAVTCALFGGVVLGMTSMGEAGQQLVAQGHAATPA